jgi:hypothetical protein
MALASSTFGWDDQSLKAMQCSRLVAGLGTLGRKDFQLASWLAYASAIDAGV